MSGRRPHPVLFRFALVPRELAGCRFLQKRPHDRQPETAASMGMHRIVVVEDDVLIRLDLVTHLRAGGHAVVGAADSAAEAVSVVELDWC